jgi:hypothetical protein
LDNVNSPSMRKAFQRKAPLITTRQPTNLKNMLVRAKFELSPTTFVRDRQVGLVPCGNCKFCRLGYIQAATEFVMWDKGNRIVWKYKRLFTCDSTKILYVLFCRLCLEYYLGKAITTKTRISKHASDVRHPENSKCRKCTDHLRTCSKMEEPFFHFYPFFYVDEPGLRHFLETRFRLRWHPTLNSY